MRRNDIVETVVNAVVNNIDFPKSVAKLVDDTTGLFDEIYDELDVMGISTTQYVQSRIKSRAYGMCKRCNNLNGEYNDYEEKGIYVSEDFAISYYNWYHKKVYSSRQKGAFRLLIALRANCYGDEKEWINRNYQVHRIDDADGYRVGNIVLIPRKVHDKITNWLRKHPEITDSRQLMEELGIMAEIRRGWQLQVAA